VFHCPMMERNETSERIGNKSHETVTSISRCIFIKLLVRRKMNSIYIAESEDPAGKLSFILHLSKNSSSSFVNRTNSSEYQGKLDLPHKQTHEICLCCCNTYLLGCCSKHNRNQPSITKKVIPYFADSTKQEQARYLAMFRDFYAIPDTTEII
jgi:hypothetical protein